MTTHRVRVAAANLCTVVRRRAESVVIAGAVGVIALLTTSQLISNYRCSLSMSTYLSPSGTVGVREPERRVERVWGYPADIDARESVVQSPLD